MTLTIILIMSERVYLLKLKLKYGYVGDVHIHNGNARYLAHNKQLNSHQLSEVARFLNSSEKMSHYGRFLDVWEEWDYLYFVLANEQASLSMVEGWCDFYIRAYLFIAIIPTILHIIYKYTRGMLSIDTPDMLAWEAVMTIISPPVLIFLFIFYETRKKWLFIYRHILPRDHRDGLLAALVGRIDALQGLKIMKEVDPVWPLGGWRDTHSPYYAFSMNPSLASLTREELRSVRPYAPYLEMNPSLRPDWIISVCGRMTKYDLLALNASCSLHTFPSSCLDSNDFMLYYARYRLTNDEYDAYPCFHEPEYIDILQQNLSLFLRQTLQTGPRAKTSPQYPHRQDFWDLAARLAPHLLDEWPGTV